MSTWRRLKSGNKACLLHGFTNRLRRSSAPALVQLKSANLLVTQSYQVKVSSRCACVRRECESCSVCSGAQAHQSGNLTPLSVPYSPTHPSTHPSQVADFNLSRALEEGGMSSVVIQNPRWLAPERLEGGAGGLSSDVWSFGTVLWVRVLRALVQRPRSLGR